MNALRPGPTVDRLTYGHVHNVVAHLPVVVRHVRQRRDLSLREAADEIGISHTHLYYFERGNRNVGFRTVLLVLAWLDTQRTGSHSAAATATSEVQAGALQSAVKRCLTPGGVDGAR